MSDLERAKKLLADECGDSSVRPKTVGWSDMYIAEIAPDRDSRVRVLGSSPLAAARRAIEMYRLVKYGPNAVEQMRSLRSLIESLPEDSMGVVSHADGSGHWIRDEAIDRINKFLAHFPEENNHAK